MAAAFTVEVTVWTTSQTTAKEVVVRALDDYKARNPDTTPNFSNVQVVFHQRNSANQLPVDPVVLILKPQVYAKDDSCLAA